MKTKLIETKSSKAQEEDEGDESANDWGHFNFDYLNFSSSESTSSISSSCSNSSNSSSNKSSCSFDDNSHHIIKILYGLSGKSKKQALPIPNKNSSLERGNFGDDVGFAHETSQFSSFGLADGVSGNSKKGFDAKLFPQALMNTCKRILGDLKQDTLSLYELLSKSHILVQSNKVYGSSTVCLMRIDKHNNLLDTLNLGDSGYMIIRNKQVLFKSVAQSHRYNAPYQIGCTPPELSDYDLYRDQPEDSICLKHKIKFGDFLILSSDGLFDNLYEDEIALIINNHVVISLLLENITTFLSIVWSILYHSCTITP